VLGGAELYLLDAAQYFRESCAVVLFSDGPFRTKLEQAGVKVRVAASQWSQEGERGGVPRPNVRGVFAVLRLAVSVALEARGYDLIFANTPKALTVAALAGRLARRPVLWAHHDLLDPAHFSAAAMRAQVSMANWGADRVLVCSEASAAALIREGGRAECTHVVYHGIDSGRFDLQASVETSLDAASTSACATIAVFGRVTQWKGQHIAIEMLARIPELRLLIVGDTSKDPEYTDALRRRADEIGVAGRVCLLGHRDDVPELLRTVDIVLHTSVDPEPLGRVIVEAMLAGRPVVATNGGGVPEIIEDGVSGMLVPPGDVDALAVAVSALLREPARASAMAEAGRKRARAKFTLDTMLSEISRHVDEVARR
jgi:glycosyltransferase involved in cell wall biosynthesis